MFFLTSILLVLGSLGVLGHPTTRQDGLQTINNCYVSGQVALTFDDGPYDYEGDVANALNGGKGTFFLNGNNYVCIYDRVDQIRALHDAGHTLGSHTWSHADLTTLDEAGINDELQKVEDAFVNILGLKPLYFRPPYGSINDLALSVLAQRGYKKVFLWSEDIGDANGESVSYSENVYDGVINNYPNPHLVLDHSTIQTTSGQVLPYAVPKLQQAGYQLVAVDTCLGGDGEWPYIYVREPGTPDNTWHC
ncbi:deacetylase [Tremella mesenterica]|uniref:Deacetylase n=1 Tax=Tremella mesenterica TaxID=5217 RepID=A0A4Q1BQ03_TREME|nr:deacetylase [Tremella mesenterica]